MALPEAYDRDQVDAHLTQRLNGLKIEFGTILSDAGTQMELIKTEVSKVVSEGERIREQVVIDSTRGDQLRHDVNVTHERSLRHSRTSRKPRSTSTASTDRLSRS